MKKNILKALLATSLLTSSLYSGAFTFSAKELGIANKLNTNYIYEHDDQHVFLIFKFALHSHSAEKMINTE